MPFRKTGPHPGSSPGQAFCGACSGRDQPGGGSIHRGLPLGLPFGGSGARLLDQRGVGARDNGAPGIRAHYHPNYYGAFVLDPDGHNIEAVCHAPG